MQRSRFTILYRDVSEGEHVLYSVLTGQYAGIDDATLRAVERWHAGALPEEGEMPTAQFLLENGFLTASRAMDDERLREYLESAAEGLPETMYITLMPTLVCNLACTYCFQKDSPAFNRMSDEVESKTVRWVIDRVAASGCRRLVVHYFGGEPLTRKDYVLRTAEAFSASMQARGEEFSWEITTNGIGLDLPFVTSLREFGDGFIKVTLDGDRETHDEARVYRDGRGSFSIIFANLLAVAGHVRLRVGGNFMPGQEASYERLLERMEAANILSKIEAVRFKPVVDTSASHQGACTGCTKPAKTTDTLIQINQSVQKRRPSEANAVESNLPSGPCELHWKNSFTIDPDGGVFKCPAVAGRPEVAIGNVQTDLPLRPAPLLELRPWEKCGDCAYLPVCVGGCLGGRYLTTGRMDEVDCRKEQFEVLFRESITRRYLNELGDREWEMTPAGSH